MKKVSLLILVSLVLLLAFASCEYLPDPVKNLIHKHEWTDATCTAPKTCECGETEGEALGHDWAEATCDSAKTCKRCQATEGEPLEHDWAAPTCTAPKTCKLCQATDGEPFGHDFENANCTEPKVCSVCGEKEGEALGHTPAKAVKENVVAPNCTEAGKYDLVVYCSVCKVELEREKDVVDPALGHTAGKPVQENPVAPSCTAPGSYEEVIYCSVEGCGVEMSRETKEVAANGHTDLEPVKENETAPTCTAPGSYDLVTYCEVCGTETSRVNTTVDPTGHTPLDAVKENYTPADCENDGVYDEVVYCGVCDAEISRVEKTEPKLGHDFADATCQAPSTCTRCGATTGELAPCLAGEMKIENVTAATCTEDGQHDEVYYCVNCETEMSRTTVTDAKLGHELKDATCDAPLHCTRCDFTEGEAIANHTPTATVANGQVTYKCSTCEDTFTTEDALIYDGSQTNYLFAQNNGATISVVDGAYEMKAGEQRAQYMLYGPSNDINANGVLKGFNAQNNALGVLSFRMKANATEQIRFIVMSARNNPNWAANGEWSGNSIDVLAINPNEDGTYRVNGNSMTQETMATVNKDEWFEVQMFMQINTEGIFTISYYINGEFFNVYSRDLVNTSTDVAMTIKNLDINNFYICGWTEAGTGVTIDDIYFGYAKNQEWLFDEHEHKWVDADCENAKHCTACGEVEGEALGHSEATREENVVAPDCVNTGKHDVVTYCTVCTKELGRETVTDAALGHTPKEAVKENESAPDCTVPGKYDSVVYCDVCNAQITRETVTVPALGHTEETLAGKAATCTATGLTEGKKCTVCGEITLAQEIIPALGHTEETLAGKAATCTETGLTEGKKCSVCGETLLAQTEIPMAAHTYDGDADADCNVCGAVRVVGCQHTTTEVLEAKAATCTEAGLTAGEKCSECGEIITAQEIVPALGHTEVILEAKAATCTETGLTEGKMCSVCEVTLVAQEVVAALGHNSDEVLAAKDPTCTETGLTAGAKCSRCGAITKEQQTVPALGHSFTQYVPNNNATCTADGTKTAKCDRCDVTNEIVDEGTKLDHTPAEAVNENVVAPTCTAKGSHDVVVKCSACGEELSRETVEDAMLPHDFTAATCTTIKTCKVCGTTEGALDSNAHKIFSTYQNNKLFYACENCDYRFDVETFDYLDGTNYNGVHCTAPNNTTYYTTNPSNANYPVQTDGYYEFVRKTDAEGVANTTAAQLQMWLPSSNGGTNKFSGFSSAFNSIGYLSFRINAYTDKNLEMKLVDNRVDTLPDGTNIRWGDLWAINVPVFAITPATNGVATVNGFGNKLTQFEVDENNYTGWFDVAIRLVLDGETDKVIAYYYINGEYVGTYNQPLSTHTNAIQGVYINSNNTAAGTGYKIDNLTFGYTAHKHNLALVEQNNTLTYTCECGTTFKVADEYVRYNGGDNSFAFSVNGGATCVKNDQGQYEVLWTDANNSSNASGKPGAQPMLWIPSNANGQGLQEFTCDNNSVGIISMRMKTNSDAPTTFVIAKPRNDSSWSGWNTSDINILTVGAYSESGVVIKGGLDATNLTLATIPVADGWSEWFDIKIVIELHDNKFIDIFYYINGVLCGSDTRDMANPGGKKTIDTYKIGALYINGWIYTAGTGYVLEDITFGSTANGHNTLDGQAHKLPAGASCKEAVTCSCGWTGIAVDHDFGEVTCAAPATCKGCGATKGDTLPHSITSGVVDGKPVYGCSECDAKFTLESQYLYYDGTNTNELAAHYTGTGASFNGGANKYVSDGEVFVGISDQDATVNNEAQLQMWIPKTKDATASGETFTQFTLDNASVGAFSIKVNLNFAYKSDIFAIKLVDNAWGAAGCIDIDLLNFAPVLNGETVTGYKMTGYGTNPADTGRQDIVTVSAGEDGWSGWIDVKVILAMNPTTGNLEAYYFINGEYVASGAKAVTTTNKRISCVYLNLNSWKTGTGVKLDDIAFGHTIGGHNVFDGQYHKVTETNCGEKSTCVCGWSGYTLAHNYVSDCATNCTECGLVRTNATPHANLVAGFNGTTATYTCADCNSFYALDGGMHDAEDMTVTDADSSHTYTLADGRYTIANNGTANGQHQFWVPGQTESAELAGFTNANNATGFLSFRFNAKDAHNTGIEFKINANRGQSDWNGPTSNGWADSSVGLFKVKPLAAGATQVEITGYNGAALGTVAVTGEDGWTGWMDVVIKIQLTADNMIAVDYYINGAYVKTIQAAMVIHTYEINSLYIAGRTNTEGEGYMLENFYFGYTVNGMQEVVEPFYKEVIAAENVQSETLKTIVDSKFKQCDQCTTVNAQGGTPVYVLAEKDGADVEALYVSRTYAWAGTEAEEFTEFRFALDSSKKVASFSFDYKINGTVEENPGQHIYDGETLVKKGFTFYDPYTGESFVADAYVQAKTVASHTPPTATSAEQYPELQGTDLILDGEWHTMEYTFETPEELQNILLNLYHFQGEMLIANLNIEYVA